MKSIYLISIRVVQRPCPTTLEFSFVCSPYMTCFRRLHGSSNVNVGIYAVYACRCKDVAVVGGGFLGTEVSLAMANRGMKVWQVYAEAAPLSRCCACFSCYIHLALAIVIVQSFVLFFNFFEGFLSSFLTRPTKNTNRLTSTASTPAVQRTV